MAEVLLLDSVDVPDPQRTSDQVRLTSSQEKLFSAVVRQQPLLLRSSKHLPILTIHRRDKMSDRLQFRQDQSRHIPVLVDILS